MSQYSSVIIKSIRPYLYNVLNIHPIDASITKELIKVMPVETPTHQGIPLLSTSGREARHCSALLTNDNMLMQTTLYYTIVQHSYWVKCY